MRHLRPGAAAVASAFLVSGITHLLRPKTFRPLIPPMLPAADAWILGTGVAEIVSAVGLLRGETWASKASMATLVVVWPGNMWHAVSTQRDDDAPAIAKAVVWARLPLQLPMIAAAMDPYVVDSAGRRP